MVTNSESDERDGVVQSRLSSGPASIEVERDRESSRERSSLRERLVHEVRTHPFGYSVLAVFLVAGPYLATLIFPQAPPAAAAIGGLAFGIYAALCTVPQKFM